MNNSYADDSANVMLDRAINNSLLGFDMTKYVGKKWN